MELYESLMTDDWLLDKEVVPAFYESDSITDDGFTKPCMQVSSNSDVDLLSKAYEDEGLGVDLDWLDSRIDFNLLDSLELMKEEPLLEPTPPAPVKKHDGHLSEFQTAAIDLLESLMVENNSEPEVSYTTLTPKIISPTSSQPLETVSQNDHILPDSPVSLDTSLISYTGSMVLSEEITINPQWDGSCPMTPEEVESLLSSPPVSPDDSLHSSDSEWVPYEEPKKARAKPYSRPTETATATPKVKGFDPKTKKERKKVQNKNAATRYRQKKKSEADFVANEFDTLSSRNSELKRKVEEMEHEIQYMKGILKDIYKVKGLITD